MRGLESGGSKPGGVGGLDEVVVIGYAVGVGEVVVW